MRLVFCIQYLDGISGGAERVLASVANGLVKRGYDIDIVTFDRSGAKSFYNLSDQVRLHQLGGCGSMLPSRPVRIFKMMRCARNLHPDLVFAFLPSTFVLLSFYFWPTNIKLVCCEHILREWYKGQLFKYIMVSLAGNLSFGITFLSEAIARDYTLIFNKKKIILRNPVREIKKKAQPLANQKKNFTMLAVGRLVEFKDHKTLINAFSFIADEFPNWRLKIIGEGHLRGVLDNQISACSMEDKIQIQTATHEIEAEYADADLFVIPSLYEGFGLVTAEALSAGLPCVGFKDCEGTNKIIKNDINGVLVEATENRAEALADALSRLLRDEKKMRDMGKEGLKRPEYFELDYVLDRWEETINSVLKS